MPSASSGKAITKIKINKNDVGLYFGKKKIIISNDAYLLSYLYVGKTMSKKEISTLVEYSQMSKLLNYSISLLKKGHYTEWKMREKLYAKDVSKTVVNRIIKKLKEVGLIDDRMYIEDYLCYAEEMGYGKNRIIKELQEKGFFAEQTKKLKFSEASEKKKARQQIAKNDSKMSRLSFEKRKQKHYQHLLVWGFDSAIAQEVVNGLSDSNHQQEQDNLRKDYQRVYQRLSNKYEGKDLRERLLSNMKNKGYHYRDIVKLMEEQNYANDQ
ncbi:MAG TPA: regulatory protein RecX [Bacilli bacterium]|nr:regulatory protein RecX [Bacilli bacterium]